MCKIINSKKIKLTEEMYNLAANLNALIIMINAGVRSTPIITIQNQKYCLRIFTIEIYFNWVFDSTKCFQYFPGHLP